jgi:putative Mn2+ efflux pump MntP
VTLAAFCKLLVIAISLGLDVFAVCVGVGMRGTDRMTKLRIGIAFTTAEVTMTLLGVLIGHEAGRLIGEGAGYIGFAALVGVGIYMLVETRRESSHGGLDLSRGAGLLLGSLSISLDSLGIGFSIRYIGVPLAISVLTIAIVAATATTLGLALGRLLGQRAETAAAVWAGVILIGTGVTFALMRLAGITD